MVQFLRCAHGVLVNIASIHRLVPKVARKGDGSGHQAGDVISYRVVAMDGSEYEAHPSSVDVETLTSHVIPAAPGSRGLAVSFDDERPPTTESVMTRWLQIIAWRIDAGGAGVPVPVLPDDVMTNEVLLIELEGKRLLQPHVAEFETPDEAIAALAREARLNWDRDRDARAGAGSDAP